MATNIFNFFLLTYISLHILLSWSKDSYRAEAPPWLELTFKLSKLQKSSNNIFKNFLLSLSILFCFSDFEIRAAVRSDQLEILKLFLKGREDKNPVIESYQHQTVMMVASQAGSITITNFYIANFGK